MGRCYREQLRYCHFFSQLPVILQQQGYFFLFSVILPFVRQNFVSFLWLILTLELIVARYKGRNWAHLFYQLTFLLFYPFTKTNDVKNITLLWVLLWI